MRNLSFRGFAFKHGNHVAPELGYEYTGTLGTMATNISSFMEVRWADRIAIENCSISQVATHGLWFHKGVTNSRVSGCVIEDMGGGGIRVGDTSNPTDAFDQTLGNRVENNIVRSIGHRYAGAVGIWIGQASDNVIARNQVSNTSYSGITVGWRWGYTHSVAKRNLIEFNHVHDIGRGELSDLAGIYLLGPSEGTHVRNNVVRNVRSYDLYGRWAWGIYADEGTTGVLIEKNLVVNAQYGGFFQHYGRNNVVQNNIFAFSPNGQVPHSGVLKDNSYRFTKNIIYWNKGPFLSSPLDKWNDDGGAVLENNIYFYAGQDPDPFGKKAFEAWQAQGKDAGSIYEDPGFVDAGSGNFALKPGAAAFKIGFEPFDYCSAGMHESRTRTCPSYAPPSMATTPTAGDDRDKEPLLQPAY